MVSEGRTAQGLFANFYFHMSNFCKGIHLIISGFTNCILAHSPDNSFMGFVVEQHLNDSDVKGIKRENWALVYGKNDYMYEVSSYTYHIAPSIKCISVHS